MTDALVEELMLPLHEYPSVPADATLAEALEVLERAQQTRDPGLQPHRAVLVKDGAGRIVGKVGHFAILQALLHPPGERLQDAIMRRAGVSDELARSALANLSLLGSDLESLCERLSGTRVSELAAETVRVEEGTSILEAARALFERRSLSVLVTREGTPVGVLRLSDVFDAVSRNVRRVGRG